MKRLGALLCCAWIAVACGSSGGGTNNNGANNQVENDPDDTCTGIPDPAVLVDPLDQNEVTDLTVSGSRVAFARKSSRKSTEKSSLDVVIDGTRSTRYQSTELFAEAPTGLFADDASIWFFAPIKDEREQWALMSLPWSGEAGDAPQRVGSRSFRPVSKVIGADEQNLFVMTIGVVDSTTDINCRIFRIAKGTGIETLIADIPDLIAPDARMHVAGGKIYFMRADISSAVARGSELWSVSTSAADASSIARVPGVTCAVIVTRDRIYCSGNVYTLEGGESLGLVSEIGSYRTYVDTDGVTVYRMPTVSQIYPAENPPPVPRPLRRGFLPSGGGSSYPVSDWSTRRMGCVRGYPDMTTVSTTHIVWLENIAAYDHYRIVQLPKPPN